MSNRECGNIQCLAWGESDRHPAECVFEDTPECEHDECLHRETCIAWDDHNPRVDEEPDDFEEYHYDRDAWEDRRYAE